MQTWLSDNLWAVWLGAGLVLGVVEAATADLVFLMLAGGALVGAVAALVGAGGTLQCLAAGAAAIVLLLFVRPVAKRRLLRSTPQGTLGVDGYVGRRVVVTDDVSAHAGYAVLDGATWSARTADGAPTLPVGAEAFVDHVRGAALVLTPSAPPTHATGGLTREDRP